MPNEEEWLDAGMIADESLGRPAKRTPQEGIAEMRARIKLLQARIAKANANGQVDELRTLNSEFREACDRLTEYQTQLEGRN